MNAIRLVVQTDAAYIPHVATMLRSVLANLRPGWGVHLYLLHAAEERLDQEKVNEVIRQNGLSSVSWLSFDAKQYKHIFTPFLGYVSYASYIRLLMASLLPQEVDRILYLDVDLIVTSDLVELWNLDMKENIVLAAIDGMHQIIRLADEGMFSDLEIDPRAPYFNAGVLLVSIKKWREQGIEDRVLEFCRRYRGQLKYGDQCLLNAALIGQWERLPATWNHQGSYYLWYKCLAPGVPSDEFTKAVQQPKIVHFAGKIKPWHAECDHPFRHLYPHYGGMVQPSGQNTELKALSPFRREANMIQARLKFMLRRIFVFRSVSLPVDKEVKEFFLFALYLLLHRPWLFPLIASFPAWKRFLKSPIPVRQTRQTEGH
jgi:lipopolysaccharide biosynthesis glycosyltransferase